MSRPQNKRPSRPDRSAPRPSQDEISREAFRIYQARHGAPGDPIADWFQAERIVMARISQKAPREAQEQAGAGRGSRRTKRRSR